MRKRGLITDGMYRFIRHPNYLGEIMTYGGVALLVWHLLPVVVLAWVWGGLFTVNMTVKEASMSRYPEWAEYKKHSGQLLPPVLLPVAGKPESGGHPTPGRSQPDRRTHRDGPPSH